jgi:conjugal transfer mating pair stabilization protein TraG
MQYIIHVYNGGEDLIAVLNAVAILFKSKSTYLTPIGQITAILGGLYAAVRSMYKGELMGMIGGYMLPTMVTFLLFFSVKTTVWVKDEVTKIAPTKIDNIPFGVSFIAHVATTISHFVSEKLEETMLPLGAARPSGSGIMYGVKALAKIRDIQIDDPILRYNAKEYMRQCYMMPYVIANFGGRRAEAIKKEDLLQWLDENPVKGFGIKPKNEDGSVGKFLTCKDAGKVIKRKVEAAAKEPKLMKQFAAALGIQTGNETAMEKQIKAMTIETFKFLEEGVTDLHVWMKQAMILNANREALDDKKSEYGLDREFPELIKMQATRGLFQQSMGSIVGGEMSQALIPAAVHPTMLALVVMLFVVVLPFTLLPGGWNYVLLINKVLIWVASWPVFYTIVHCIMMIQIKDQMGAWGAGGLSIIGQAGFTEILLMKYATSQQLITLVPAMSYAIVHASGYALSGIASGLASVGAGMGIGSSISDGNLSMGQISNNNITKGQHNLAPSLRLGSAIDDGMMNVRTDHDGRSSVVTEYADNLVNNVSASEFLQTSTQENLSNATSKLASLTERHGELVTLTDQQGFDFVKAIASGEIKTDALSQAQVDSLKTMISNGHTTTSDTSSSDSKTKGENTTLGGNTPFGGININASNTQEFRKSLSEQDRQSFDNIMESAKSAARTRSFTANDSEDRKLGESYGANLSKQEQISKDISTAQQNVDTYSSQLNYTRNNSGTINKNLNEPFLQEIINRNDGINSKDQAVRWASLNKEEANAIARDVIKQNNPFESKEYQNYIANIKKDAPSTNTAIPTGDSLESKYKNNAENIKDKSELENATIRTNNTQKPSTSPTKDGTMGGDNSNVDPKQLLKNQLSPKEQIIADELQNNKKALEDEYKTKKEGGKDKNPVDFKIVRNKVAEAEDKHKGIVGKSTVARVLDDIGNTSSEVLGIPIPGKKGNKKNDSDK